MDYKKLGQRIREERLKAYLTQEQLAELIELSAVYVGQIERGERKLSIDTLLKISNTLGLSVDFLLQDSSTLNENAKIKELLALVSNKTDKELQLVINTTKAILSYISGQ